MKVFIVVILALEATSYLVVLSCMKTFYIQLQHVCACVRACVRPTGQFRVLMDRRNWPGRLDSENGNPGPDD